MKSLKRKKTILKNPTFLEGPDIFGTNMFYLIRAQKNNYIVVAEDLFSAKQYSEAEDYLLNNCPKNIFACDRKILTIMGLIQIKLQQIDLAFEYFKKAKSIDNQNKSFLHDAIGMAHYFKENFAESSKCFDDALSIDNKKFEYYLHLAYANERIVEEKLSTIKKNETSLSNIGHDESDSEKEDDPIKQEIKQYKDRIKEAYESATSITRNSYYLMLNYGVFQAKENYIEDSEKMLKKAARMRPDDINPLINLGNLELKRQQFQNSIDYFERALAISGEQNNLNILQPYMIALIKLEIYSKLEGVCKQILKIDKKNMKALANLIISLRENRNFEDLEYVLKRVKVKLHSYRKKKENKSNFDNNVVQEDEKVIKKKRKKDKYSKLKRKIKEKLTELRNVKKYVAATGFTTKRPGEEEGAIKREFTRQKTLDVYNENDINEFSDRVKQNPKDVEANYHLGVIRFKEEDFLQSQKYFFKVKAINPKYKVSHLNEKLGDIEIKLKNDAKSALDYYNRALKAEPTEVLYIKTGRCYELLNNNQKALKEYKNSYEINNNFVWSMFQIGCVLMKLKKTNEAMDWLKKAYDLEKENVDILQKYGDVLVRSDKDEYVKLGIQILEKAKDFYTGNVDILCSLALGYEKKGKLKEAIELLENANNYPAFFSDENKLFQLAYFYEKDKNFTKAVEFFKSVLVIDRQNIPALLHLGFIYKAAKEYKKSLKCFRYIIERDPNNSKANFGLARLYQKMTNTNDNDTINFYLKSLKLEPDNFKANTELGIIYLKNKQYDKALKYLNHSHELNPNNVLCLNAIGNVYQELKDYDKAEEILTEAYKLDRNNLGVISSLGDILFTLGKFESAVLKYEKANKLGEIPEVHLHLGHCYYILEQFEYAVSNYISALKLVKNTRHDYYYYCANALVAATRIKDGVKCYKAAIKIKKTKGLYYYNLAIAYFLLKKYPKTLKNLEKLKRIIEKYPGENDDLKITKNDIEFLKFKSYFLMPSIDYDKCEQILKNLISNNPDNIEYYDSLASLQEKTNKPNLAIETYKDILKIDKENITAKNALRRLDPNSLDENIKEEAKNSSAKSKISKDEDYKESSDKIKGEIILINEKSESKKSESNKASSILKKTISIKDKISSENEKLISDHSEKMLNKSNKQSNSNLIINNKQSSSNLINHNLDNKKEDALKSGLHLIDIDDNESDSDTIKNEDEDDL